MTDEHDHGGTDRRVLVLLLIALTFVTGLVDAAAFWASTTSLSGT